MTNSESNTEAAASQLFLHAVADGASGSEDSMYPNLIGGINCLLPKGFESKSHTGGGTDKPDLTIVHRTSRSEQAFIEVKREATLADALKLGTDGMSQIARYRRHGNAVFLTDGMRWFDVTTSDDLSHPVARFVETDSGENDLAEKTLGDHFHIACRRKPNYRGAEAAVTGISGVISQLSSDPYSDLEDGWGFVRERLGLQLDTDESLDSDGAAEVIAFTLLAIASGLPALPLSLIHISEPTRPY